MEERSARIEALPMPQRAEVMVAFARAELARMAVNRARGVVDRELRKAAATLASLDAERMLDRHSSWLADQQASSRASASGRSVRPQSRRGPETPPGRRDGRQRGEG